ncbi:alpha-ketoacid dehydrogenase subunit beta [Actinomycetota bacterium]
MTVTELPASVITMTYREAIREAMSEAMRADPRVFLMGEDVGEYGGCYAVSKGMLEEFGGDRIIDTPLSESGFVGAGIGAALGGMRPIVEVMTVNFSLLAMDQIVNTAALMLHMSGGQFNVPIVIRMATGAGRQLAAQHSHSWEAWYAHVPGLKVVAPATVDDARWMLPTALDDPDPVIMFEHAGLYNVRGDLMPDGGPVDLTKACIRRSGDDVTLVTYGGSLAKSLDAADVLASDGVSVEVLDLRSLRPIDVPTIMESISRTHRLVVVDEGWKSVGLSAEIVALVAEHALWDLDAPVRRVCGIEVPVPYAKHMEEASVPHVQGIVGAVREVVGR